MFLMRNGAYNERNIINHLPPKKRGIVGSIFVQFNSLSFFSYASYNYYQIDFMEQGLSLVSKFSSQKAMKLRKSSTTNHQTIQQFVQSSSFQDPEVVHQVEHEKHKQIKKRIEAINKAQQSLHEKCRKIIDNLTNQIKHKDDANSRLEEDVEELRGDIRSSKADLEIISNYISKQKGRDEKSSRWEVGLKKLVLDSTKDSGRLDKSHSGGKGSVTNKSSSPNLKPRMRPAVSIFSSSKVHRQKTDMFCF